MNNVLGKIYGWISNGPMGNDLEMAERVNTGRSYTNFVNMKHQQEVDLNPDDPLDAALIGANIRIARQATTYQDLGNAIAMRNVVRVKDVNSQTPVVIRKQEVNVLADKNGKEIRTTDTNKVQLLMNAGYTLIDIVNEESNVESEEMPF